jgi:hypothetical protein
VAVLKKQIALVNGPRLSPKQTISKSQGGIPNSNDHSPQMAAMIAKGKKTLKANIAKLPTLTASQYTQPSDRVIHINQSAMLKRAGCFKTRAPPETNPVWQRTPPDGRSAE